MRGRGLTVDRMIRELQAISNNGGGDEPVKVSIEEQTDAGLVKVVAVIDNECADANYSHALLVLAA